MVVFWSIRGAEKASQQCEVFLLYLYYTHTMLITKVNTKKDIQDSITESHAVLNALGVKSIGLFGSFLRNEAQKDSDVDLLVDFHSGKKSFDNFMELAFYLEDLFGRKVEIITPQSLSKHIGPHILKEVEIVYQS
jgi:hypothetical protein